MPAAIPFLAYAGASYLGASALVATAISFVSSVAVGQYQKDKMEGRARREYNKSLQDRFVTVRSALATRKYVVGTVRVGGALLFGESILVAKTSTTKAQSYLDTIHAWAANECALLGYYLDDEYVPIASFPPAKYQVGQSKMLYQGTITGSSGSGSVTLPYTPVAGSVVGYVYVWTSSVDNGPQAAELTVTGIAGKVVTFSGVPDGANNVDVSYTTQFDRLAAIWKNGNSAQTSSDWGGNPDSPRWTANHRLRGVAHSRFLMRWDEAAYQTGAPDPTAVLQGGQADGHPFYDPRDASNPAYTDNPALLAAWWMTLPQALGGCGYPSDWIDWVAVGVAANICDELVTVKTLDGSSTESIKRYRCHTVLDTADAPLVNLDKILRSMGGRRAFTGGKYKIVAGAFRAATITITDADIVGTKPITLDATGGDVTSANVATGSFADATKNWQGTSPTSVRNSAYVTSDGAESTIDVDLAAVTDPRQANYLMGIAIELSRPCMRGGLSVSGIGEDIALFDTVQLSVTNRAVYAGRTFEVTGLTDNWDGTFDLVLNEIRSTSYALDYTTWTPLVQPTPPDLSYLWDVDDVAGFTATMGAPQKLLTGDSITSIVLSWTAHTQAAVQDGGKIELRYRRIGDVGYTSLGTAEGDATQVAFSASLSDGSTYEFQARARNRVTAVSQWSSVYATVIGSNAFVAHTMSITPDPGFENMVAWNVGGTVSRQLVSWNRFGRYALRGDSANCAVYSKLVPIDDQRRYRATVIMNADGGSDRIAYVMCIFYDANGAAISGSSSPSGWPGYGAYHYFGLLGQQPPEGALTECSIAFGAGESAGVPAGAKFVSIGALLNYDDGVTRTGSNWLCHARIQQLQDTALLGTDAATSVIRSSVASQDLEASPTLFEQGFTPDVSSKVEVTFSSALAVDLVNLGLGKGWCGIALQLYEGTTSGALIKTIESRVINWTSGTNGTNQKGTGTTLITYDVTGGQLYTVRARYAGADTNHFDNPVAYDAELRVTAVKR